MLKIGVATLASIAILATFAEAKAPKPAPSDTCLNSKLSATAKATAAKTKCHQIAKSKNEAVDQGCLDSADDSLADALALLLSKPPCSPTDDSAKYQDQVDTFVGGVTAGDPCASKIKASGKLGSSALKCQAKQSKKGPSVVGACNEKAQSKLDKSFAKADAKGCLPTGGADEVKDQATDLVDGAASILLFDAGQQPNGALGSRATTDAICSAAASAQMLTCTAVVSLLSYTGDQVSDFPTSRGVPTSAPIAAGAQRVADNWADFLDGSWATCLGPWCAPNGPTAANILSRSLVFTGSNNDGTLAANCDDWTNTLSSNAVIQDNCYGSFFLDDAASCAIGDTLDSSDTTISCEASLTFLCLCY